MSPYFSRPKSRPAVAATAIALLATLFMSFSFTVMSLWCRVMPGPFIFPAAVAVAVVTALCLVPQARQGSRPVAVTLSVLGVIAGAVAIGALTIY